MDTDPHISLTRRFADAFGAFSEGFCNAIRLFGKIVWAPIKAMDDFVCRDFYDIPPKLRERSIVRWKEQARLRNMKNFSGGLTSIFNEKNLIYFGEIVDMPGHGIFGGQSGKVYFGYHTSDFEEVNQHG